MRDKENTDERNFSRKIEQVILPWKPVLLRATIAPENFGWNLKMVCRALCAASAGLRPCSMCRTVEKLRQSSRVGDQILLQERGDNTTSRTLKGNASWRHHRPLLLRLRRHIRRKHLLPWQVSHQLSWGKNISIVDVEYIYILSVWDATSFLSTRESWTWRRLWSHQPPFCSVYRSQPCLACRGVWRQRGCWLGRACAVVREEWAYRDHMIESDSEKRSTKFKL